MIEGVTTKTGKGPGPVVAIFGGVHGNEKVGVEVVRTLAKKLVLESGTVHLVEANPKAIQQNVRAIKKNLNRCFVREEDSAEFEDIRARELMDLLDTADVLIDIHASNTPGSTPFIICEGEAMELAHLLNFELISSGWDAIEPGAADGYMHRQNKPALCLECGYAEDAQVHQTLAEESVRRVLSHLNMLEESTDTSLTVDQKHLEVYKAVIRENEKYSLARSFKDFEILSEGEDIAVDGERVYKAKEGDCIIFARPNAPIGGEAFILGRYL